MATSTEASLPFAARQTVFTRDGQKHYVREVLSDGRVLASPWLTIAAYDGDDEEYPADIAAVKLSNELFATAPTAVVDGDVMKARAELGDLQSQIAAARTESREAERERAAVMAKIEAAPKFARLLDFIDGKITHFVVSEYHHGCSIKTWDGFAVYREDGLDKGVKLLTLFGSTNGDTEWRLNHYRDGSGTSTTCQPCGSREEAQAVAGEWLERTWLEFDQVRPWIFNGAVESADKYGLPVPAEIREALTRHVVEANERAVEKAAADLAAAQDRLAKAKGATE